MVSGIYTSKHLFFSGIFSAASPLVTFRNPHRGRAYTAMGENLSGDSGLRCFFCSFFFRCQKNTLKNGEKSLNDMTFFKKYLFVCKGGWMGWIFFLCTWHFFLLLFRGSKQMNNAMMQHAGCFFQLLCCLDRFLKKWPNVKVKRSDTSYGGFLKRWYPTTMVFPIY